jgi:hypothetical protein
MLEVVLDIKPSRYPMPVAVLDINLLGYPVRQQYATSTPRPTL